MPITYEELLAETRCPAASKPKKSLTAFMRALANSSPCATALRPKNGSSNCSEC